MAKELTFTTILYEKKEHVATIILNRPEVLNCFNRTTQDELKVAWEDVRTDDDVRAVILTGAGDRAFCTGIDRNRPDRDYDNQKMRSDPWNFEMLSEKLTARQNNVWKPVVTAVNGMCCGGGFYFLYDSDITISSESATFFDPHVSYGQVAALEPIGMARKIPLGEIMRIALMGLAERVGAQRAFQIGLVSEVVPSSELMPAAWRIASTIASFPPAAVQGTVKAIWRSLDMGRQAALDIGILFPLVGNLPQNVEEAQKAFKGKERPQWRLR